MRNLWVDELNRIVLYAGWPSDNRLHYITSKKSVCYVLFCDLKQFWTDLHNLWHTILKILASKHIDSFLSRLNYVATLPENAYSISNTNRHVVFLSVVGGCEKILNDATNWRWRIAMFLESSDTDWCVWCTLLTAHEVKNKITFSAVCTVCALPLGGCLQLKQVFMYFLAAFEGFAPSNSYLEILSATSMRCIL